MWQKYVICIYHIKYVNILQCAHKFHTWLQYIRCTPYVCPLHIHIYMEMPHSVCTCMTFVQGLI